MFTRKSSKPLAALLLMALPGTAMASEATAGVISSILPTYNGAVLFNHTGTRGAPPTCQGPGLANRWALDTTTAGGQSMLAVLLSAWASNKRIIIIGTGACTIWGDTETVSFYVVED